MRISDWSSDVCSSDLALLGWPTLHGVIFGFSLATASTVVLLRAMEERRLLETRRVRIAVGWLIVEDLACVLALVLMPVVASVLGTSGEKAITFGDVVVKILTTLIDRKTGVWGKSEEHTSELQ